MNIQTISSDYFTLEILPEMGASILNLLSASGRAVLRHVDLAGVKTSSQCASFSLLPYSNRIRDAHFEFQGQQIQLQPTTKDGLVQHGDVRNRPWQVQQTGPAQLQCNFDSRAFSDINWPWAFTAQVEYVLHGPKFETRVTLTNADTRPMPAGMGLHPYFARLQDGTDPLLSFAAPLTYDTDERMLPLGAARPLRPDEDFSAPSAIGPRSIDRAYAAWNGQAQLDWGQRKLHLSADPIYSHLIAFTAPGGSLALEPVTHATDAFNLAARGIAGVDKRVLGPGQSMSGAFRVELEGNW